MPRVIQLSCAAALALWVRGRLALVGLDRGVRKAKAGQSQTLTRGRSQVPSTSTQCSSTCRPRSGAIVLGLAALISVLLGGARQREHPNGSVGNRPVAGSPSGLKDNAPFRGIAQRLSPGIMTLETIESSGTGFVISRKHRLVATAGHVADFLIREDKATAFLHGNAYPYSIARVWYHPRVERSLNGSFPLPSESPETGEIQDPRFDLAVVQLAGDGPDLPVEWELARTEELEALQGMAVGCLSCIGAEAQNQDSTDAHEPVLTTTKVVPSANEVQDPAFAKDSSVEVAWQGVEGCSGSPVFLPNGHVIGLLAGGGAHYVGGAGPGIAALRRLLAHHEIKIDPGTAAREAEAETTRESSRLTDVQAAIRLTLCADTERRAGKYYAAARKCNEARRIAPDYTGVFLAQSKVYLYFLGNAWRTLSADDRRTYAEWAFDDAIKFHMAYPIHAEGVLIKEQSRLYFARADDGADGYSVVLDQVKLLLNTRSMSPLSDHHKAYALNLRAQALHLLGEMENAEQSYADSIQTEPVHPRWYLNRAQYWIDSDRPALADADRRMAQFLRQNPDWRPSKFPSIPKSSSASPFDELKKVEADYRPK